MSCLGEVGGVLGEYRYTNKPSSLFDLGNPDFPSTHLHLRLTYQSIVSSRIRRLESFPFFAFASASTFEHIHTFLKYLYSLNRKKKREGWGFLCSVQFCSVVLCLGNGFLLNFIQLYVCVGFTAFRKRGRKNRNVVDGFLIYRIMY